jgi:ATP-dependent DNA helicase RecG
MEVHDSVMTLKGVGEKTAKKLEEMGIRTILDLLLHFPRGYEKLFDACESAFNGQDKSVMEAELIKIGRPVRLRKGLSMVSAAFRSEFGDIRATWFNMPYISANYSVGTSYRLAGKFVRKGKGLEVVNPSTVREVVEITPVYPQKEGVSGNLIRKLLRQVLDSVMIRENLPADILAEERLMELDNAVRTVHFPSDDKDLSEALERLRFQEMFSYSLKIMIARNLRKDAASGIAFRMSGRLTEFKESIPYELTKAQSRCIREILIDEKKPYPMNRLLQGDVGSGKTIVALTALFNVVENGYQGALMVPTEILASQHRDEAESLLSGFGIRIEVLTGSTKKKEADRIKKDLAEGIPMIIIGTHALLEESVSMPRLGLAVTDEQHRFGVNQRARLIGKGQEIDVLVMSATPIPRTMALALYSDLDVSTIDELPPGRKNIRTVLFSEDKRNQCYSKVVEEIRSGRQAYIVTPLIDEDSELEASSVEGLFTELSEGMMNGIPMGMLHGRMKGADKDRIMRAFKAGELKALVSTTVIEVGVNVGNATVMLIENAERFGLAQLHQLRGRVGRGEHQSWCLMVSKMSSEETKLRLETLVKSNDGFFIAEEDMKQRGTGQLFGVSQSGGSGLSISDLARDYSIFIRAGKFASRVFHEENDEYRRVKAEFTRMLEDSMEFICLN